MHGMGSAGTGVRVAAPSSVQGFDDGSWKARVFQPILLFMADTPTSPVAPAGWLESLERSKAQIAAGESVPLVPILDRLRTSAERLEAEQGVTEDGVKISAGR
jgi:hypothetical protein